MNTNKSKLRTNSSKEKFDRTKIYKNESEIEEKIGTTYNITINHSMKERDTFNKIFPTSNMWKPEQIFKTTKDVLQAHTFIDPYLDTTFNIKMDNEKQFNEEMLKAKNMMIKKGKDEKKDNIKK